MNNREISRNSKITSVMGKNGRKCGFMVQERCFFTADKSGFAVGGMAEPH
ncbi:hypothetical protein HNQ91_005177 [Filimonas zeae]|nr:hypothetical protein [Filimonas zeae]MDR6342100.1 hypothetical protein [Filimonas zeae]